MATTELDEKIGAALERLSHVIRTLLWEEAVESRLTPVQIQALIYLSSHQESLCRVNQVAEEFGLTPATVSDTISALENKGLLYRIPWGKDRRVSILRLTEKGQQAAEKASRWNESLLKQIKPFPPQEKQQVLVFLLKLIEALYHTGVINVARICQTCRFFRPYAHPNSYAPHHCALMDKPLAESALQVDCPDHKPKSPD